MLLPILYRPADFAITTMATPPSPSLCCTVDLGCADALSTGALPHQATTMSDDSGAAGDASPAKGVRRSKKMKGQADPVVLVEVSVMIVMVVCM